jgi:hypothetical protein
MIVKIRKVTKAPKGIEVTIRIGNKFEPVHGQCFLITDHKKLPRFVKKEHYPDLSRYWFIQLGKEKP